MLNAIVEAQNSEQTKKALVKSKLDLTKAFVPSAGVELVNTYNFIKSHIYS
jgi:hypothetical protein